MKVFKNKISKEVQFTFPDDAKVRRQTDSHGRSVIHIANYPPARVEGKTRYLGGTVICDHKAVDDTSIIDDIQNTPEDIKTKKYLYHKDIKKFEEIL